MLAIAIFRGVEMRYEGVEIEGRDAGGVQPVAFTMRDGRLQQDGKPVAMVASPFCGPGFASPPKIAIIHFTAGSTAASSAAWFADKSRPRATGSSAHVVIDRDGSIIQCVGFDSIAWHAGRSAWQGLIGLNQHSFGIELANLGCLHRVGSGWAGTGDRAVADPLLAAHRNGNPDGSHTPIGWERYPAAQIDTAVALLDMLVAGGVSQILGHDDIAPTRKWDPGPAFDMTAFRNRVFGGRADDGDNVLVVLPAAGLFLRSAPDGAAQPVRAEPWPSGTQVRPMRVQDHWIEVTVLGVNAQPLATGWMREAYLGQPGEVPPAAAGAVATAPIGLG